MIRAYLAAFRPPAYGRTCGISPFFPLGRENACLPAVFQSPAAEMRMVSITCRKFVRSVALFDGSDYQHPTSCVYWRASGVRCSANTKSALFEALCRHFVPLTIKIKDYPQQINFNGDSDVKYKTPARPLFCVLISISLRCTDASDPATPLNCAKKRLFCGILKKSP